MYVCGGMQKCRKFFRHFAKMNPQDSKLLGEEAGMLLGRYNAKRPHVIFILDPSVYPQHGRIVSQWVRAGSEDEVGRHNLTSEFFNKNWRTALSSIPNSSVVSHVNRAMVLTSDSIMIPSRFFRSWVRTICATPADCRRT